jgi:hypothetical protein
MELSGLYSAEFDGFSSRLLSLLASTSESIGFVVL